jgi:hypothetical protein
MPRKAKIDPVVKEHLGFDASADDAEVLRVWKAASTRVCKPCWELKYCPYGPLVEDSPLLPPTRADAEDHNAYLRTCLETGKLANGADLDPERRKFFERTLANYDPANYPETIPPEIADMQCRIFGHICPVVFNAERFTETSEERRSGPHIPRPMMMRVARRDNYTCQICGTVLLDDQVEFDHIIPRARGGATAEHNLRVACFECNRRKSKSYDP